MSFADKLSILRIIIIPIFISLLVVYTHYQHYNFLRYLALGLFLLAVLTDFFDGLVARIKKEKSPVGEVIDPLADKLLLLITFVSLYFLGFTVPWWVVLIVVCRDVVILGGIMILNFLKIEVPIMPSLWGKFTTFFQMLAIIIVLLDKEIKAPALIWIVTVVFTIISGIGYVSRGIKAINVANNPSS